MAFADRMKVAGWFSICYVALVIPLFLVSVIETLTDHPGVTVIGLLLAVVAAGIGIFIYLALRDLLNTKAGFHGVDILILILILVSLLMLMLRFAYLVDEIVSIFMLFFLFVFGIITLVFGIKLLSCPDRLYGYLKPLAILYIIYGAMVTTVLLAIPAIFLAFPIYILYALTFFKAGSETGLTERASRGD